jgi:hypothetical protein
MVGCVRLGYVINVVESLLYETTAPIYEWFPNLFCNSCPDLIV